MFYDGNKVIRLSYHNHNIYYFDPIAKILYDFEICLERDLANFWITKSCMCSSTVETFFSKKNMTIENRKGNGLKCLKNQIICGFKVWKRSKKFTLRDEVEIFVV